MIHGTQLAGHGTEVPDTQPTVAGSLCRRYAGMLRWRVQSPGAQVPLRRTDP